MTNTSRRASHDQGENGPVDFLIITALPEERDAVLDLLAPHQKVQRTGSPTYYRATIPGYAQDSVYAVAVTMLTQMGNVEAAQHTTQAIQDLAPDYILMVGIAGGVKQAVRLGDVIVAEQVLYYEPGKVTPSGTQPRPDSRPVDHQLLERAKNYTDLSWREMIHLARPKARGKAVAAQSVPQVHFGPIAVGEAVVTDPEVVRTLRSLHSKIIGIEMESFGVALAAANSLDRPRFLAVRGVSDYADPKKDDRWRVYAAQAAAAFTIGFLRSGPVPSRTTRIERRAAEGMLILIRHKSMDAFPDTDVINSLPLELANYRLEEISIDQSDLVKDRRLTDLLEAARRQADLGQRFEALLQAHPKAKAAYYGIAHIPLQFLAGYLLTSKVPMLLFDFNRSARLWNQLQLGGEYAPLTLTGLPARVKGTRGDVIVRISISFPVTLEAIAGIVPSPIASLHLGVEHPARDNVTSERQVHEYGRVFRDLLDTIHNRLPNTERVHLFCACSPPISFYFGQQISPSIHPRIIVYNHFAQDVPQYSWGLEITAPIESDQFIVRPATPQE
jgi:nucleoside phosphorylase